ncbi:MAG TPA: hypothetical protein VEP49_01700 [Acidimicrobiia bacterium]|nr:hypothetical protein [Acidimicrobiia bacterium]
MLSHDYSYAACLEESETNAWTIDDCFRGRAFDFTKAFLPERLAGVRGITCLDPVEQRTLNQIRANSYCHLFAFGEEFIVPLVVDNAMRDAFGDEQRLWALLRFGEEELKHQELMRRACQHFSARFGVTCELIAGREGFAESVVCEWPLTGLLLASMMEWLVQLHYVEHVRDARELDPLVRDILRYHWIDESRHAQLDSLLIEEVATSLPHDKRERAIDELLALVVAADDLLTEQLELDVSTLERSVGRRFAADELREIFEHQQRAYRWTFLVSGLEHPRFAQIVRELTDEGPAKVARAARRLRRPDDAADQTFAVSARYSAKRSTAASFA